MSIRSKRLSLIRELVSSNKVSNQEDLLAMLARCGCVITQATLSRDLKELKVAKSPDVSGGYHYSLLSGDGAAAAGAFIDHRDVASTIIAGIVSIEFSGQLCVVKTRPGYANMVASIIDSTLSGRIMGTIAGDDTVLLVLREGTDADSILDRIDKVIPNIRSRRV